jgi:hypothetical protein
MKEAVGAFETSVYSETTRRYIQEGSHLKLAISFRVDDNSRLYAMDKYYLSRTAVEPDLVFAYEYIKEHLITRAYFERGSLALSCDQGARRNRAGAAKMRGGRVQKSTLLHFLHM